MTDTHDDLDVCVGLGLTGTLDVDLNLDLSVDIDANLYYGAIFVEAEWDCPDGNFAEADADATAFGKDTFTQTHADANVIEDCFSSSESSAVAVAG